MCYTNTAVSIKILAAFCFEPDNPIRQFEEVMPPVKNLDKYMAPLDGTILVGGLAGISIAFDACLYIGVENERPAYVLASWVWGILDTAFDFCIGIAAGNMTFMDGLARTTEAPTTERPSTRPFPYGTFRRGIHGDVDKIDAARDEADANTSALIRGARERTPRRYPRGIEVDREDDQLPMDKLAILIIYVVFRLVFKVVALAGIRNYVTWMRELIRKKRLAMEIGEMASPVSVKAIRPPDVPCPDAPPIQFPPPGMIAPWPEGFDDTFGSPAPPGFKPAHPPGFKPHDEPKGKPHAGGKSPPKAGFKPPPSAGFKPHEDSKEHSHHDNGGKPAPKAGFKPSHHDESSHSEGKPAPKAGFKPAHHDESPHSEKKSAPKAGFKLSHHDESTHSESSTSSHSKPGFKVRKKPGFAEPPKAGFKAGH